MVDTSIINKVSPDQGGRKTVAEGAAILQIEKIEFAKAYNSGLSLILEVTVLWHEQATIDPEGSSRKISLTGLDEPKGSKAESQWGRIRTLLGVLYNVDPHSAYPMEGYDWSQLLDYVVGPDQPVAGYSIKVNSYDSPTKKSDPQGNPYMFRVWSFEPVPQG